MKAIIWFLAILIVSTSCDESELHGPEFNESKFDESKTGTGPHKKRISSINSSSYGGSYTVTHFQYNGETVSQVRNVYHEPDPNGGYQIVSDVVVKYKYSNGVLTGIDQATAGQTLSMPMDV